MIPGSLDKESRPARVTVEMSIMWPILIPGNLQHILSGDWTEKGDLTLTLDSWHPWDLKAKSSATLPSIAGWSLGATRVPSNPGSGEY